MIDDRISAALAENVLTTLCFDDTNCKLVRAAVTPQLFESSVFREIAGHAIDFIDSFGQAIKDHLPDHLEGVLNGEDKRKAESYKKLLDNLFMARETTNGEYVISQLQKFVRQQNIKSALKRAVEAIEDGNVDQAEVALQKGLSSQIVTFNAGLNLSDPNQLSNVFSNLETEGFLTGIPELDRAGVIPRRKELFGFVAPRGKGKSWFCTHLFKQALLQRWKPLIITLEMSQERYAARFLQSFFSISRREAMVRLTKLQKDGDGHLERILHEQVERMVLNDPDTQSSVLRMAKRRLQNRVPFYIKEFPTKQLDMTMLEAYLDGLERFHKFTPDLIILDYPDLMTHDSKNKRIELGEIFEQFRGLCVERNAAGVTPTQGNAEAERATLVTGSMVAEDISKLATWDTCVTYSQTLEEYKLNLARLFVAKSRNERGQFQTLISQAYDIGQFIIDSAPMGSSEDYWDAVAGGKERAETSRRSRRREDKE